VAAHSAVIAIEKGAPPTTFRRRLGGVDRLASDSASGGPDRATVVRFEAADDPSGKHLQPMLQGFGGALTHEQQSRVLGKKRIPGTSSIVEIIQQVQLHMSTQFAVLF
jgi:hypothetical protein